MEFSQQIREIRNKNRLTQEEMAQKLHVTRQAVSNWENGKNLPDLGMLVEIARTFHVSLDWLILGGDDKMNDMTEKLIEDGSEGRRAKRMMVAAWAGAILVLCGVALFLIKGATVEYVDAQGILHENFWMIGVGWILILLGVLVTVVNLAVNHLHKKKTASR